MTVWRLECSIQHSRECGWPLSWLSFAEASDGASRPWRPPSSFGEQNTDMRSCQRVSLRSCTVSFTGPSGVVHTVEVVAESLYEAAVLGLNVLKRDGWVEAVAPGTTLHVQVREPATMHSVRRA